MKTARIRIPALLLLAIALVACTDHALEITAKAVADSADAVKTITTTVIDANKQGLITDADTGAILAVCLKVTQANAQASKITRNMTTLPADQRGNVWAILKPVSVAVNESLATGLLGIKNEATKQKIQLSLTVIQGALGAVQVALGGQ